MKMYFKTVQLYIFPSFSASVQKINFTKYVKEMYKNNSDLEAVRYQEVCWFHTRVPTTSST